MKNAVATSACALGNVPTCTEKKKKKSGKNTCDTDGAGRNDSGKKKGGKPKNPSTTVRGHG